MLDTNENNDFDNLDENDSTGAADRQDLTEQSAAADEPAGAAETQEMASRPDQGGSSGEPEISAVSVVEAVLFAADEPLTPGKLADIVGVGSARDIRAHIDKLNEKYQQTNCAFRIEPIAGGFQMLTLPPFNTWLRKLVRVRSETKLSPAALETLAIIAYKQPIMRAEVEAIRGVAAGEIVRQLCEKGVVKIVGRAEELGRPFLYGTTRKFLDVFGLNSLKDLPGDEELNRPQ